MLLLSFISCDKEESDFIPENSKSEEIESRTIQRLGSVDTQRPESSAPDCTPGIFSIYRNHIRFQDSENFLKTIDFLTCASREDLNIFEESIPIQTVKSQLKDFRSRLTDDLTDEEKAQIALEYGDGNLIQLDETENSDTYSAVYKTFQQFRNVEGDFVIGNQIMSEFENTTITIINEDWEILSTIKSDPNYPENWETYNGNPKIIIQRHPDFSEVECCPDKNSGEHRYDNNDKRIRGEYRYNILASTWIQEADESWYFHPIILWSLEADSRKKDGFGFWKRHRRHWLFPHQSSYIVLPFQNTFTPTYSATWIVEDNAWTADISTDDPILVRLQPRGPFNAPRASRVCVTNVSQSFDLYEDLSGPLDEGFTISCGE